MNREQKSNASGAGRAAGAADVTSGAAGQSASGQDAAGERLAAGDHHQGDLDLEGLDLTVETVEERISPSETNVFDK
ncbi:hypothetical protein [Planctomycetes bacterium Poly30]|uniref:hypothetical protein n=1 Tax=Saltatorellus ferox TaxID=2528018 RepID=UPI0011A8C763